MEAVRKPKAKERTRTQEDVPPPLPARTRSGLDRILPDVPTSAPGTAPPIPVRTAPAAPERVRERSPSPEPEEIEVPPEEQTRPSEAPPTLPPPRYIFPRTNGVATGDRLALEHRSVEAPPLPEKTRASQESTVTAQQSTVTQPSSSTVSHNALPAYPVLDTMPEVSSPVVSSGLPSYSEIHRSASEKEREAWRPTVPREEAPPMYPRVGVMETTDLGLLSEQALLSFYHNELYEASDDIVDKFCKEEERPNGPLFDLLKRFKAVCDDIVLSGVEEQANAQSLSKCLREVWINQPVTQSHNDTCGENKPGSGVARFDIATLSTEKLEEMRKLLTSNRDVTLRKRMSQEVEARGLALQIQWIVIGVNTAFLSESRTTVNTLPTLLDAPPSLGFSSTSSPSRVRLRSALSDLFAHLRLPQLPRRFSDAATAWVTELVCVLQKACLASNGVWLLCHVLRVPSPSAEWTAPLIQTFVQSNSSNKLKMDYCMAMMAQLMSPIRSREKFLSALTASHEETTESWMILDDDGEKEHNPIVISEGDLASILEQLPMTDFYSLAFLHFTTSNPDRVAQFVSLLAFQLLLMKILHDGLETYAELGYKQFCKQIGMTVRKSVRELATHWKVARGILDQSAEQQLQREMDRVVLLAVHYIISKRSLGLWQFLIDLPYDAISDECRLRVEYLLRKGGDDDSKSVRELFEMPQAEIVSQLKNSTLAERLDTAGGLDTVFLVNALACLVAQSSRDPTPFLREMVQTCFVDASTRDSLYKVGGEAIGTVLGAKPAALDALITIVDRSIDHMEDHAVDIFASAPLHLCKLGESIVGGVIGKWLIARAPDRAGNRVARRVLSALNWGYGDDGVLWMSERTHAICADTVLKAHVAHCARSNGLIAKSVGKIAKLASKIPDYEQHFSQFCWDLLIKLKLPIESSNKSPEADLAAYFVHAAQHAMTSADAFASTGLNYVGELVNAGCTSAAVILMTRALALHYTRTDTIIGHPNFAAVFDRVIHADQCSYAYQLIAGPSSAPTLIVRMISCAIVFEARRVTDLALFLRAWVDALCVRRATVFNTDQVSLQLLGTIVRLAFERDPKDLLGITDQLQNAHMQQLTAWRESSKGIFSMFSGPPQPPALIPSTHLSVSMWSSYACLIVEDGAFDAFTAVMHDALAKKDKITLDEAVKKATSKVSYQLPIDRLPVFRWMELVRACGNGDRENERERDSPVLALSLQRLCHQMFTLRTSVGKKYQFARKYYTAPPRERWQAFEESLDARPTNEARGLSKAVCGWIRASVDISLPSFSDYSRFDLDYLLQLVIADDKGVWLDFVDLNVMAAQDSEDVKWYAVACHERGRTLPAANAPGAPHPGTIGSLSSRAAPFPTLPSHPSLPAAPTIDRSIAAHPQLATSMVQPILASISKLAIEFCSASDLAQDKDREYCDLLHKLYGPAVLNVAVVVKCSSRCAIPSTKTLQVSGTEFNTTTDAAMTKNRDERNTAVTGLQKAVMDAAAVQTASLEFIARELCTMATMAPQNLRQTSMQAVGRSLFFLLTSSVASATSSPILFPPATASLEHTLGILGREFINNRPEEQLAVMKLVLEGFVLSDPLVDNFSPECLSPNLLVEAYERLSDAVATPELSQRALILLSRLSIDRAVSLPPTQFRPLMPLAFRNVAVSAASTAEDKPTSPLGQLCMEQFIAFVFHQFPFNFPYGLELTLNGCNSGSTPPSLLDAMARKVDALPRPSGAAEYRLDTRACLECVAVTSRALIAGSSTGMSSLFSRWHKYTEAVGAMMQLFVMKSALANFNAESPPSLIQNELADNFVRLVSLFGPLIVPSSPSLPPFSPSATDAAGSLVNRFVATAGALPHSAVLPPGSQNVPSLVWRFYAEQLAVLTHGTMHYYSTLETYLVRLQWSQFWPSLRALQAMEDVLSSRSADCAPFVSQVVVRVPWSEVLSKHVPEELRPSYLATLFLVLVRLCAKPGHIAKVRASMLEVLKTLAARIDWPTVTVEDADRIATAVSVVLPFDTATNATDTIGMLKVMWRKQCSFSSSAQQTSTDGLTILKQCYFIRAELNLCIRTGTAQTALPAYNALLSDVSTVAAHQDNLRAFSTVARELTCVWTKIADVKLGESLVTGWQSFLATSPSSPLVLTCLNTIVGSLNADQHSTALRVMESTLHSYFKRPTASWSEAAQWASFPEATRDAVAKYLFCIPNSDNKLVPLSLTMRCFILHGGQQSVLYEKLLYYVTNVKPKYVEDEAAFCVILGLCLQWMASPSMSRDASTTAYRTLMEWLKRAAHDERGSGILGAIGLGKKNAFTNKMCVALQLLELYLTQQRQSGDKSPELKLRRNDGEPVMNSRVGAYKEMAGAKVNQQFGSAFAQALPFFTRVETHHMGHANMLLQKVAASIFGNPRFLET